MTNQSAQQPGSHRTPAPFLALLALVIALALAACGGPTPKGALLVNVAGLSDGANIAITGPAGYSTTVTSTTTLADLAPGSYTVTASPAANYFVTGERDIDVEVLSGAQASASFTYVRAFELTANAVNAMLSLGETTELTATVANLHADNGSLTVQLEAPAGWDLSVTGPWPDTTDGTISVFVTDDSAALGANEFVFSATGEVAGQTVQLAVPVSVQLLTMVTTASDDAVNPPHGSLRSLVQNPRVEGQTITFDPALAGGSQLIVELDGQLEIRQALNIAGFHEPGARVLLQPAAGSASRLVDIRPATPGEEPFAVELSRLELVAGSAPAGEEGGAIKSNAELSVLDSVFRSNHANHGGAVHVAGGSFLGEDLEFSSNEAAQRGGALYAENRTQVQLLGSGFTNNVASNGGAVMVGSGSPTAALRSELLVDDSTFLDNEVTAGGGALTSYANATVRNSTFRNNVAVGSGGAIRNQYRMVIDENTHVVDNTAAEYGGILSDGILLLRDSVVEGNSATAGDGGGIYNGWGGGDFRVDAEVKSLRVENSRILNNTASGNGGGIYNVQLLEVVNSTIEGNTAAGSAGGGGLFSISLNDSVEENLRGTVRVSGSTFSSNTASLGRGGAIAVEVEEPDPDPAVEDAHAPEFTMVNSTIANNTADADGGGIALSSRSAGLAAVGVNGTIGFSTIAGNRSEIGQGGGVYTRYGDLTVRGNIIASNSVGGAAPNEYEVDLYPHSGWAVSLGYNWISADPQSGIHEVPSDTLGLPVTLGALADNGGPTETMWPADSALADVPAAECVATPGEPLTTDQRGAARPGPSGTCYRGAVEASTTP